MNIFGLKKFVKLEAAGEGGGAAAGGAAGAAAGAAGGVASGAAAGAAASGAGAAAAFDWKATGGIDDLGLATVTAKGWKGPSDLLGSYVNLEKLVGAPPELVIKLPKDVTPESMAPVYDKLGRPKTAADYKLPVPAGDSGEFAKHASGWMHELGLSANQGVKLAEKWNAHFDGLAKTNLANYTKAVDADKVALRGEWGDKHDANHSLAQQAAVALGVTAEQVAALEKTMGYAGTHKFFQSIGSKMGEAEFVNGGGRRSDFGGLTPESARAQITALKADKGYIAKFNHSDPIVRSEAQKEMERLNKVAYPGQVTL